MCENKTHIKGITIRNMDKNHRLCLEPKVQEILELPLNPTIYSLNC
jgi:hypothetical protein